MPPTPPTGSTPESLESLLDVPLTTLADKLRTGSLSASRLVRGFLDRIEARNPALNAMVYSTAEQAVAAAAKADEDLRKGIHHGPLHGIPMTLKDSLDTKDAVSTWGTLGRRDFQPGQDATCAARLRASGAILMGKTNTPEFTLAFKTDNLVYGRTNNPFDLSRTPGGSSGGAAALIAAGATPFDIGTDTGGSIRLPSHFCGIAGLKPTTGRVPCTGNALPSAGLLAPLTQPGPMARHVADLDYLLNIISGPDLADPYCVDAVRRDPAHVDVTGLRFAHHASNGMAPPVAAIQSALLQTVDMMRDRGLGSSEAIPSGLEMASLIYARLFAVDGGDLLDTLLEDNRTNQPSPQIAHSHSQMRTPLSASEINQTLTLWDNYRSSMLGFFEDFDILLCPVNARTALGHEEPEDMLAYSYTLAYNLTGWPSLVIRCGTDDAGLPVGLQIIARPFREDHCLAVGQWLETLLQSHHGMFSSPT